jgi:hypothetical protein
MKLLLKLFITLTILLIPSFSFAIDNLNVWNWTTWTNKSNNLDILDDNNNFFAISTTWEAWIKNMIFNIARDLRIVIFLGILVLWFIMVFRLLFTANTEEEVKHFKKWILWASVWLILMQIPFTIYSVIFDKEVNANLAVNVKEKLINPFVNLMMLLASFAFIAVAIYAFYRIITANWNEENIKRWKTTIIQAIIWFLVLKIADFLVKNTLSLWCTSWLWVSVNCSQNITKNANVITTIINWVNTFVALAIVVMIMYAWFQILIWGGSEDRNKKAKNIMIYIAIWLLVLFANYLILTFFIVPEQKI